MLEDALTIIDLEVLYINDFFGCPLQKLLEQCFALDVRKLPQIMAAEIQEIECVVAQCGGAVGARCATQRLKIGNPIRAIHDGFAVYHRLTRPELLDGLGDTAELLRPVKPCARIDGHLSMTQMGLCPVSICLDLVEPIFALGRVLAEGRIAELDEPRERRHAPRSGRGDGPFRCRTTQRNGTHGSDIEGGNRL